MARRLKRLATIDKAKLWASLSLTMLRALSLTLGQIGDPAIIRVIAKSLALTLVIWIAFSCLLFLMPQAIVDYFGWGDEAGFAATLISILIFFVSPWLVFRAAAIFVIGFFADHIVAAVEARHYPGAELTLRQPSTGLTIGLAIASLVRQLIFNILLLPLIWISWLLPPVLMITLVVAYLGNALLLARDLGEMVATRHLNMAEVKAWLWVTRGKRAIMGAIVTGIFMIPILNLIAPIVGAGMTTHLFHRRPI